MGFFKKLSDNKIVLTDEVLNFPFYKIKFNQSKFTFSYDLNYSLKSTKSRLIEITLRDLQFNNDHFYACLHFSFIESLIIHENDYLDKDEQSELIECSTYKIAKKSYGTETTPFDFDSPEFKNAMEDSFINHNTEKFLGSIILYRLVTSLGSFFLVTMVFTGVLNIILTLYNLDIIIAWSQATSYALNIEGLWRFLSLICTFLIFFGISYCLSIIYILFGWIFPLFWIIHPIEAVSLWTQFDTEINSWVTPLSVYNNDISFGYSLVICVVISIIYVFALILSVLQILKGKKSSIIDMMDPSK
jgi:hypothetical protein